MKTKSLILAGLALVALVSCNKTPEETPVLNGGEAYLSVKIGYANPSTRGTAANPEFYYGTADENKISGSADFFFYTDGGAYFTHASQTIDGNAKGVDSETDNFIEWVGDGVVVLKGLTSAATPKYMAVVLNGSSTLITNLKGKSITEAQAYITDEYASSTTAGSTVLDKFTMTSTSFDNSDVNSGYYCATLTPAMFKETEAEAAATKDVAVAYVERLAVKASLAISAAKTTIGSTDVYALGTDTEVYDGTSSTSYTNPELYVKINGWGLNSTTKDSYTYKNIDASWTSDATSLGFTWNVPANFRSYWGKSTNYGLTATSTPAAYYPNMYANDASSKNYDASKNTLSYISYNDCSVTLSENAYCRENTNTKDVLRNNNFSSAVTSVLLTAQVVDKNASPVDLVIFEHKYYTKDGYFTFVLNRKADDVPYVLNGSTYVKADASYLEIVNDGDAYIHVQFKDGTYFSDNAGTATDVATVNAKWAKDATLAEFYNEGRMYYNIPIEHLRGTGTFAKNSYEEADYGVVRNHWYNLDVTAIANLGHAVAVPDEPIVPSDQDTKKYFVAAQINILSWKVVKQSVSL